MLASTKRLALVTVLILIATAARSDGIGAFDNGRGLFGRLGSLGQGAIITLSNTTIASTATVGTTIGTLAVVGGTGVYTFTFTSNPGTLFAISGANLNVAAALTAGSDPITIQANNGAGGVITQPFTITVTAPGCTQSGKFDLTNTCNDIYLLTGVI
jgi:hypothetical protein